MNNMFFPRIGLPYIDNYCINCQSVSNYLRKTNPTFQNDTVGSLRIFFYLNSLPQDRIAIFGMATGGTTGVRGFLEINVLKNIGLFGDSNRYFGATYYDGFATTSYNYSSSPISAGTWNGVVISADLNIYINGSLYPIKPLSNQMLSPIWFNDVPAGIKREMSISSLYTFAQQFGGNTRFNNIIYYNRNLNSTESSLLSDPLKMNKNPVSLSPTSANNIVSQWDFENNANDMKAINNLTVIRSPTYISP